MLAVAGGPSVTGRPWMWTLFFARQPEPDLEFTEEELEQTTNVRASAPMKSPKKSGGRPLVWLLVLVLVGAGAYVAMEPEMITDLLGSLLGESPMPPSQPPMAGRPAPAPGVTPGQPAPATPPAPPAPSPHASTTAPATASTPPPPAPPAPPAASPAPPAPLPPIAPPAPASAAAATPLFGEGQRVTAMLTTATPGDMVTLMQDAAGTKPGPAVRPGVTLTILDGELQPSGWIYLVRTDEGAKGWIPEKQLRLKP